MRSLIGMIFNIQKFSLHDGPGIRTTVFFKGCALKCAWCHNPESQFMGSELLLHPGRCIKCGSCLDACRQGAISLGGDGVIITDRRLCIGCSDCAQVCFSEARQIAGQEMSAAGVMQEIEEDLPFYEESRGGVTFSGGEPLFQSDFLLALLRLCKEKEIHTVLDTCGYAAWEVLNTVRDYIDLFLYDIKFFDDDRHRHYTGVSNDTIMNNLQMLAKLGHQIILRIPIIPGINDDEENVHQIAEFASTLPYRKGVADSCHVDLLPYHHIAIEKYQRLDRTYALAEVRPPSEERMKEIAKILRSYSLSVKIGG